MSTGLPVICRSSTVSVVFPQLPKVRTETAAKMEQLPCSCLVRMLHDCCRFAVLLFCPFSASNIHVWFATGFHVGFKLPLLLFGLLRALIRVLVVRVSAMRLGLSGSVLCKFPLLQLCWFSVVYFRFLAFVVSVFFLSVSKVPSIVWVSIAVSTSLLSNFLCHPQARFWVRKLLRFFAKCWRGLQSVGKIRVLCIQHNTVAVVVSTCAAS